MSGRRCHGRGGRAVLQPGVLLSDELEHDGAAEPELEPEAEARIRRCVGAALGAEVVRIQALPAGLGLRRFARVWLGGARPGELPETLIARVEAPEDPAGRPAGVAPEPPLEPIRALLERHGLPVPRRFGGEPGGGLELLEDVGELPLCRAVAGAAEAERRALYEQACDLVPRIQQIGAPGEEVAAFRRRLDAAHFAYKAELFAEWSLPTAPGGASRAAADAVRAAFRILADELAGAPQRLAHRDFQSANLMLRETGGGARSLVMIDLQGALMAPPEYDLVCLLRDSYVELSAWEVQALAERIRPRLPDAPGSEEFERRFDLLTLARKGKDHARFVYAARSRGEPAWLHHVPATLRHLRGAARRAAMRDPRLEELAEIVCALPVNPCAP